MKTYFLNKVLLTTAIVSLSCCTTPLFFHLFLIIIALSLQTIEANWRCGRHNLQRIQCRSENSKGVYCLQYDDDKIISGLRDNSIKVCVHPTPRDSLTLDADYIGDEVQCTRLHNIWLLFSMALLCSKCNSHFSCYYYTDCFFFNGIKH